MSLFCRWFWGLFMPNDNIDDHADAIELGQVVGVVEDDQRAGIHPLNIGNDLGGGQGMAAAIVLDGGGGGGGDTDQYAVELQAAEEGDIQDKNGIGDGGYNSCGDAGQHAAEQQAAEDGGIQDDNGIGDAGDRSGGYNGQHAAEQQAAEEGNIQDDNGGGDGGNAGQGVADPQHGLPAAIGNGDDARRSGRLRKLLFFLLVEVLRLAALYCIKTVILEDSLSLSNVLQPGVGIALIVASIAIECLRLGGVVNDTEANLIFIRFKRVMNFAQLLLSLLGVLC